MRVLRSMLVAGQALLARLWLGHNNNLGEAVYVVIL
jgi:hypothetical protein